jgi:microcystin-dependent protein
MARPSVPHSGFLIPNAQDVAKPSMAEPDRIDFNTVGNSRWGVIEGCLVTISLTSATNTAGTAIVNGVIVSMPGGQSVNVGSTDQDRYDALCVDHTGTLQLVQGQPSLDPVFPEIPVNMTLLATVLAPTGGSASYPDNVVDKRNMLSDSLLTKIAPSGSLIVNLNGTGNLYKVTGDGVTSWHDDTYLSRSEAKTVHISRRLIVDDDIQAGEGIKAKSFEATETVIGSNLRRSTGLPGSGNIGDIFQHAGTGQIFAWRNGRWTELATLPSVMPVGMVVTSLVGEDVMTPLGWVALRGQQVSETDTPSLFDPPIPALGVPAGSAPNRTIVLPDARRRVLLTDYMLAGRTGGSSSLTLLINNLPSHKHNTRTQQAGGYNLNARTSPVDGHGHPVTGGAHPHSVNDLGHKHRGMEGPNGTPGDVVALFWGGQNKIDAYMNDRSHTYSVEALQWTMPAYSNISINAGGSEHQHEVGQAGGHSHPLTLDPLPDHVHPVLEDSVGVGAPIDTTPSYLAVFTYMRV